MCFVVVTSEVDILVAKLVIVILDFINSLIAALTSRNGFRVSWIKVDCRS